MKIFWDTSAAINALVSPAVALRLQTGNHVACVHLLSEFFAIMTGRGINVKDRNGHPARLVLTEPDAVVWLRNFAGKVTFTELTAPEMLDALGHAKARNVKGGRVYDYAHAVAANKAGADVMLTRDANDFSGLLTKAKIEWP